jgi:hypothetical protein
VSDTGVPQRSDHVDRARRHLVVDGAREHLDRPFDELGDQHVLSLGSDLDESVRPGGRDAVVPQIPEHVVLVLHHPPDRIERPLVFESPVQDGAP